MEESEIEDGSRSVRVATGLISMGSCSCEQVGRKVYAGQKNNLTLLRITSEVLRLRRASDMIAVFKSLMSQLALA